MINFMMELGYDLDTPYLIPSPTRELNNANTS